MIRTPTRPLMVDTTCRAPGCTTWARSRGLCALHYDYWYHRHASGRFRPNDQSRILDRLILPSLGSASAMTRSLTPWNPWAGQYPCPRCGSADWTLPFHPGYPEWRCIQGRHGGCALTFTPEAA